MEDKIKNFIISAENIKYSINKDKINSKGIITFLIGSRFYIKSEDLEQLEENIDSIHVELSEDLLAKINAIHSRMPNPAP